MRLFDTIAPLPWREGRCKKIGLVPFHVILAKAGIQWFHGVRNTLDPGFHRGDQYSVIFSQPQGIEGRGIKVSEL
jgi:hypothetical protein